MGTSSYRNHSLHCFQWHQTCTTMQHFPRVIYINVSILKSIFKTGYDMACQLLMLNLILQRLGLLYNKEIICHPLSYPSSLCLLQEIRELQELQRIVYTFLHVITTHDLSSVFLSPKSRTYLEPMMQLLLNTSCNHKDILVRKV